MDRMKTRYWIIVWALASLCLICLGFVIGTIARGAEVTITTPSGESIVLEISVKQDTPEPPEPELFKPPVAALYWQTRYETSDYWATLAPLWEGVEVTVQNRWPGSMHNPRVGIPAWAAKARQVGWKFQPYLPANLDPALLAGVEWPDDVTSAMSASEGAYSVEHLAAMRAEIPERIACAFPERGGSERRQIWIRVAPSPGENADNWAYTTPLALAYHVLAASQQGVGEIAAGPQVYNRVSGGMETEANIRLSVALVEWASLKDADVCFWGDKWLETEDSVDVARILHSAIGEMNALPIRTDAKAAKPQVAVFVMPDRAPSSTQGVAWMEILLRANVPFDFIDDIRDVTGYKAVIIPVLYEHHWNEAEIASYEAKVDGVDSKLEQWNALKAGGWIHSGSFDDEDAAWLASTGIPIITSRGNTSSYGGHWADLRWLPVPSRIPRWANVVLLPSASATSIKPTLGLWLGEGYDADMTRIIAGLREALAAVGVLPTTTETDVVLREFTQGGETWTWEVDLGTGETVVERVP